MDKKELEQFICSTLGITFVNETIKRQITKFVIKRGLTYEDIARALTFYIQIQKNNYEPQYGIAFIEWTIDKANAYYIKQEKKEKIKLKSLKNKQNNIILEVKNFKKRKSIKKIDIGDLGDD